MADGVPRAGTKQALIVDMLARDGGATIRELVDVTGWKSNTVHAALSTLRFRGRRIAVDHAGEQRRYRMVAE